MEKYPKGSAKITGKTGHPDTPLRGSGGKTEWHVYRGGAITFDQSFAGADDVEVEVVDAPPFQGTRAEFNEMLDRLDGPIHKTNVLAQYKKIANG